MNRLIAVAALVLISVLAACADQMTAPPAPKTAPAAARAECSGWVTGDGRCITDSL